jgi:hypothetical protein
MKMYFVRNKEGKFRCQGEPCDKYEYGWTDKMEDARFYHKPGPAKALLTKFYNAFPQHSCPDLVEFTIEEKDGVVVNYKEISEARTRQRACADAKRAIQEQAREKTYLEAEIKKLYKKLNEIKT